MTTFRSQSLGAAACAIFALVSASEASAQAQLDLGGGVNATVSMTQSNLAGGNSIDLGSAGSTGWVTSMPMSLSYGSTNVNVSFGGAAGVYYGSTPNVANAPPLGTNYFVAHYTGSVTLDFSSAQRQLSMYWGTPLDTNNLSFYRNGQLVASVSGGTINPLMQQAGSPIVSYPGVNWSFTEGAYTEFSFSELGFDRVVATNTTNIFEFGAVKFSSQPSVAPIPLNAASMGGLVTFLLMLGGRGGVLRAHVQLLASRLRTRKQVQRFA